MTNCPKPSAGGDSVTREQSAPENSSEQGKPKPGRRRRNVNPEHPKLATPRAGLPLQRPLDPRADAGEAFARLVREDEAQIARRIRPAPIRHRRRGDAAALDEAARGRLAVEPAGAAIEQQRPAAMRRDRPGDALQ